MGINVKCYPYGELGENTYLITDEASGFKAVIDPGYIGDEIRSDIADASSLKYILLTHCHFDHFLRTEDYLKEYPGAELVASDSEKYLLGMTLPEAYMPYGAAGLKCPDPDVFANEDLRLMLGETEISFIHTPGHTEGGMCIVCDDKIFSGDTLFRLSVGNTSFETGDWGQLVSSIKDKLYVLNEDMVVYPGHGRETTIGYEKRSNPFV